MLTEHIVNIYRICTKGNEKIIKHIAKKKSTNHKVVKEEMKYKNTRKHAENMQKPKNKMVKVIISNSFKCKWITLSNKKDIKW